MLTTRAFSSPLESKLQNLEMEASTREESGDKRSQYDHQLYAWGRGRGKTPSHQIMQYSRLYLDEIWSSQWTVARNGIPSGRLIGKPLQKKCLHVHLFQKHASYCVLVELPANSHHVMKTTKSKVKSLLRFLLLQQTESLHPILPLTL